MAALSATQAMARGREEGGQGRLWRLWDVASISGVASLKPMVILVKNDENLGKGDGRQQAGRRQA